MHPEIPAEQMRVLAGFVAELIAVIERRSEPAPSYFEMVARDHGIELSTRPSANRGGGPVPSLKNGTG
jgi:hypothetical protein